jgi:biotin synthase-like enzyme
MRLKEAQKSQNRGDLLESVKKIQSYGMEVMAGFIVGFDNDPEHILNYRSTSSEKARFRSR